MMTMFTLKPLPYRIDALEPVMSARALRIHHQKCQDRYVTNLNALVRKSPYLYENLESIIVHTHSGRGERAIFNNAAQVWNHEFFWDSLSPDSSTEPPEYVAERLVRSFGSVQVFREEVVHCALSRFGSGWVWLAIAPSGRWNVLSTQDAENPLLWGEYPLWACDLWEHAYYLDWEEDEAGFIHAVVERLINWEHIAARLKRRLEAHAG